MAAHLMLGSSSASQPLKTGYTIVPPLSFHTNGKLVGFTTDVLNEAARREGMKLAWVFAGPSLKIEASLTDGSLDVVPAGMVTPERQQKFYVSAPWWFTELSLMTKEGAQGGPGKSIGLGSPIYRVLADKAFPGVPQVPFRDALQAASALCRGEVDSALLTHMDVHRLFLYHPREADACRVAGVHVSETRAIAELAVVARRGMEAPAERLRRRIDEMALDGTLARLAARYPDIPSSGVVKLADDLRVRYARQHLREVVFFAAILMLVAAVFVRRLLREVRAQRCAQVRLARAHRIASLGDWEVDLTTGKVDFSDAARELFCPTGPRTGFDAFLHCAASEDVDRLRAALDRAAAGNVVELDYAVNAGARGRRHIRQRAEPVRSHNRVVALVGTIQDITEYKELEAQFLQVQRLESIGRLAGGIAHDFNNLLTVINGYTAVLLNQLPQYEPSHEAAREIQKAGDRAAALTKQLLTFSRRQEVEPADIDLNEIVLDSEKMLGRLVGDDMSITTVLVPEPAPVHADSGAISQMLTNFVVNARDAMPDGGRVRLETQTVILAADIARQKGLAAGPHVLLTISDTGCGMDSATVSRIFEPFFTTKAKGRGTGLGLSTVYGIVRQCNGTLEVESEVGQGTIFRVYFPRAADTVAESKASEVQSASLRGSERILIVEDEPALRKLIAATLRSSGYDTVEAANGEEALQALSQLAQPDLVVTDVSMPGMSGVDLARRIIADRPGFRVLLISGYVHSSEDARHSGFPVLQKPFTPGTLAAHVRAVLDGARLPEHKRSAGF